MCIISLSFDTSLILIFSEILLSIYFKYESFTELNLSENIFPIRRNHIKQRTQMFLIYII